MYSNDFINDNETIKQEMEKLAEFLKNKYLFNSDDKTFEIGNNLNGPLFIHHKPINPNDLPDGWKYTTNFPFAGYPQAGFYKTTSEGKYIFLPTKEEKQFNFEINSTFDLVHAIEALNPHFAGKTSVSSEGIIQIIDEVGNSKVELPSNFIYDEIEGCYKNTFDPDRKYFVELISASQKQTNNIDNTSDRETQEHINMKTLEEEKYIPNNGDPYNNEILTTSISSADLQDASKNLNYNPKGDIVKNDNTNGNYGTQKTEKVEDSTKAEQQLAMNTIWKIAYMKTTKSNNPEGAFENAPLKIYDIIMEAIQNIPDKNLETILSFISTRLSDNNRNKGIELAKNFLTDEKIKQDFGIIVSQEFELEENVMVMERKK